MRLENVTALVFGVGTLTFLGGLYVFARRTRDAAGSEDADLITPLKNAVENAVGLKVLDRSYADGVDARLQGLLDDWAAHGTHALRIAHGTYGGIEYVGGVRTLEQQLVEYNAGLSKANSADTSPHMHGGALDVWPYGFVPNRSFDDQPNGATYQQQMQTFGAFAQARGFTWGGGWGDLPHVEVPDWASLPVGGTGSSSSTATDDTNAAPDEEQDT